MGLLYMLISFGLVHNTVAHNWIQSLRGPQSRCPEACPTVPAPPKPGVRKPHLQLGANQRFALQWTTGHPGSVYYFVITHGKHEGKLGQHGRQMLEDYLDPANVGRYSSNAAYKWNAQQFDRTHVSCSYHHQNTGRKDCLGSVVNIGDVHNTGDAYEKLLQSGDPEYFATPDAWTRQEWIDNGDAVSNLAQFRIPSKYRQSDVRAEYTNPDYDWIESVHKFVVNEVDNPREWDLAQFSISANEGPGEYIIHMVWGGYRDVIDVDVFPQNTADVYGRLGADEWVKIEHCQYPNYIPGTPNQGNANRAWFVKGNTALAVKPCLDQCKMAYGKTRCTAINVVPLNTPVNPHLTPDYNFPWDTQYGTNSNPNVTPDRDETWSQVWPDDAEFACYGFVPQVPNDPTFNPETEDFWYTRYDPADPVFYSTCYRLEAELIFSNGVCEVCEQGSSNDGDASASNAWQYGHQCMSCEDASISPELWSAYKWKTSDDNCKKCF